MKPATPCRDLPGGTCPFNRPTLVGQEEQLVLAALRSPKLSGDSPFVRRCERWFENQLSCHRAMMTPSCTQALEMAAMVIGIGPGDEVIMPSYTFVGTANAFVLRGATVVFIDVRPDTMNMDEELVEAAITDRTKAIVPVHYTGVACPMDRILAIAARHGLFVVEDAAHAFQATWCGKPLGGLGHLAAFSFHETKNVTSGGKGGLLAINHEPLLERAEIVREYGTNRARFLRGLCDKYTWVDLGGNNVPSEILAAHLWGQLQQADPITADRLASWQRYRDLLWPFCQRGLIDLPIIPTGCGHNGHIVYLKLKDRVARNALIDYLGGEGISAVFHYLPLHSSAGGARYSRFHGEDRYTTRDSERLLRLPIWYGMEADTITFVVDRIGRFFAELSGGSN